MEELESANQVEKGGKEKKHLIFQFYSTPKALNIAQTSVLVL